MKTKARSSKAFVWILGILVLWGGELYSADPAALSGVVSSQAEGQMEGVLVSAKKEGSHMTVTVVSDSQGRYAFPGDRLQPGNYRLKMRAIGYDMDDPGVVKVAANQTTPLDLKLQKTKDLASQMTNLELVAGLPDAGRWPSLVAHTERGRERASFVPNLTIGRKILGEPVDLNS